MLHWVELKGLFVLLVLRELNVVSVDTDQRSHLTKASGFKHYRIFRRSQMAFSSIRNISL